MPPKRSNTLTEAELRIMRLLWQRGESLVSDLVAALRESTRELANGRGLAGEGTTHNSGDTPMGGPSQQEAQILVAAE